MWIWCGSCVDSEVCLWLGLAVEVWLVRVVRVVRVVSVVREELIVSGGKAIDEC